MQEKLKAMVQAAFLAGQYLLGTKPTRLVSVKDFLTDADQASEEIIRRELAKNCPGIPFWGEESVGRALESGDQFVVDPFDGTVNGYHGDDHWGVSIGLVRDGRSVAGAVYLPAKRQMFFASRKSSAFRETISEAGERPKTEETGFDGFRLRNVSVNQDDQSVKHLVLVEWVKEQNGGRDHRQVVEVLAQLDRSGFLYPQIRNASTASLMMVAQGIAGGFVHLRPEPFDIAAACLIVERAGGQVTDLSGEPWSPFSADKGIIASNGVIHEQLLLAVSTALAK